MKKAASRRPAASSSTPSTTDLEAAKAEALRILSEAVARAMDVLRSAGSVGLKPPNASGPIKQGNGLLTLVEAREYMQLPNDRAVYRLVHAGKIPCVKLGHRTMRFRKTDLDRALTRFEQKEVGRRR